MKLPRITSPMLRAAIILTILCVALFAFRAASRGSMWLNFLNWNLFLAWIPLLLVSVLANHLKKDPWISAKGIMLSVFWLLFLPNSFYIVTDFIHLPRSPQDSLLFDSAMIFAFALTGFILGIASLYAMHRLLLTRLKSRDAWTVVVTAIGLCSFAIYLGRYLRWNTWDVILNPAGIVFDVSDQLINPANYEQTIGTTLLFFVITTSVYVAIWQFFPERSSKKR